jgi:hypothetical protein
MHVKVSAGDLRRQRESASEEKEVARYSELEGRRRGEERGERRLVFL